MGRIRTVKPGLYKNEELYDAEKSSGLPLRVAYSGLWTVCDREGRFEWKPRTIKTDVLPHDDVDFAKVLGALEQYGFIVSYQVDGKTYGYVPTWNLHQRPNQRESASTIPAPDSHVQARGEGKGKEQEGKVKEHAAATPEINFEYEAEPSPREVEDSDRKLLLIAQLHPKLSHLTPLEIANNSGVMDSIISAVKAERAMSGMGENDALRHIYVETRRVCEAATRAGKQKYLTRPVEFWSEGVAQYRRPSSDFEEGLSDGKQKQSAGDRFSAALRKPHAADGKQLEKS